MTKKIIIILAAIILIAGGTSIYYLKSQQPPTPKPPVVVVPPVITDDKGATPEGINSVVGANNQFALDLYAELKTADGNIFFSPFSISSALAMVDEGARGKTAEEIQSVFHFPADASSRQSSFAALYNQINQPDAKYQLSIANALWAQKDYKFLDEYLNVLEKYYAGQATNVDFKNATEQARLAINQWVEDKTNNKIKDLFPRGALNALTRLVITDAIYFKGTWIKQFDKKLTSDEDFRVSSANSVKVKMMQLTGEEANFNFAETADLQILEMPYDGDKLSMMILLPKNDDLSGLESSLSSAKISDWKSQLQEQRVDVYLPKFTFDTKYSLNGTLAKMGMPTAFTGQADFSGMDGTKNLAIQLVIHQAFVAVDEEGTEAAAATGVAVAASAMPIPRQIPVFRADHPFLFLIQDKDSGNILFLGRVSNPNK
ncbi:MAG: serpin family protein [Patescibacteria group bacterium]|nr:serpin family protein [Patescibacteria group bacterium]